jgi:hypothetical protein
MLLKKLCRDYIMRQPNILCQFPVHQVFAGHRCGNREWLGLGES